MRNRIAALVVCAALLACGDATSPEDDLAIGTGVLTLTGSLSRVDTMTATEAVIAVFGVDLVFLPLNARDSFHLGGRFDLPLPLPYTLSVDFLGLSELKNGTYAVGATDVVLLDSLGLKSLIPTVGPDFPITLPPSDELKADSGSVLLDLVTDQRIAGTLAYRLRSEAGRSVSLTGRFNANVRTFPSSAQRSSPISRLPPSPSRARR